MPEDAIAANSPYLTEHINRFGDSTLNLARKPPLPDYGSTPQKGRLGRIRPDGLSCTESLPCPINIIDADRRALRRVIRSSRGFQRMKTAAATIEGLEVMRIIRRGHCFTCKPHMKDAVRFINQLFNLYTVAA